MRNKKKETGCVYYFFTEHKNKTNKRYMIYKMVKPSFFVSNELTNMGIIAALPESRNFFCIYDTNTNLALTELTDQTNYLRSGKQIDTTNNPILLKMEDRELIYWKTYLKALSSPRQYIFVLMESYKGFLKSIQVLVDRGIVHNHLTMDTLYVDAMKNPLIADFAFSLNMSNVSSLEYIRQFFIEYDPGYLEWPMEIHILTFLLTNKLNSLSLQNIETIVDAFLSNHNILKTFGEPFVSLYKEEALQYFHKYVNQSINYIVIDVFQHFATWDNYALSIMYLRILIGIHRSIKIQNKFIVFFMKLLVSNISLNPLKRLSIVETTNKWESIMDSLEPGDYKQLLKHLTAA
jgi:hypothetical protein